MPPRRKVSGPAPTTRSQGTLSFSGVTKASKGSPITSAKQNIVDTSSSSPRASAKAKKEEAVEIELAERTKEADDVDVDEVESEDVKVSEVKVKKDTKTKETLEAEKLSDAKVKKYWREEESKRKAPRVHQQGLTMHEKILRHFDLSSQFGPCIGISRNARWQRANKLGLSPPIEVLAVLLKEENENGKGTMQTAYVDELMTSKTGVEAA